MQIRSKTIKPNFSTILILVLTEHRLDNDRKNLRHRAIAKTDNSSIKVAVEKVSKSHCLPLHSPGCIHFPGISRKSELLLVLLGDLAVHAEAQSNPAAHCHSALASHPQKEHCALLL